MEGTQQKKWLNLRDSLELRFKYHLELQTKREGCEEGQLWGGDQEEHGKYE